MASQPEARRRLAALMDKRRLELRLTWQDVAERGGVSLRALANARAGDSEIRSLTQAGIEDGLQWERGSVASVIAGGDPVPLAAAAPPPAVGEPPGPGRRSELLSSLPPEVAARVEPYLREVALAVAVAAGKHPEPLRGEWVFRDDPELQGYWDGLVARGLAILPDEGGFTLPELTRGMAALLAVRAEQRARHGNAAAGLAGC